MEAVRKWLKKRLYSIGTSMVLYFMLLISVVVLVISILTYAYSNRDFEDLSVHYTESLIAEINAGVDSYIDNIKSMSSVICENKDVQELMALYDKARGKGLTAGEEQTERALREAAMDHLRVVAETRSEITNVAVISKYQDILLSRADTSPNPYADYNLTDWFLKPLYYKENIAVSPSHVQNLVSGEYKWVISVSRAVLDPSTGEVTGVMVIDLNFYAIQSICETVQLGKSGYAYLIDDDQNIIYHPQQQLIYAGLKSEPFGEVLGMEDDSLRTDDNKIYVKNTSGLTGWTTVGVINAGELMRDRTKIVNFYFTISLLSLLFATAAALLISASITRPLKRLESTMHRVEEGDLTVRADTETNNEIGHLGKTFNGMVFKIEGLMEQAVSDEKEKRESELNALQAQINPHFLYNTLDSIIWMSASGKSEEVTDMTEALAKLFRTSISQGGNYVTVRNEIENIKSYLFIQKMRYGDKLGYELSVDECFMRYLVPKLVLQPIVENAIYHGVKLSPEGGTVSIGARREGEDLVLTVADNGVGMTPEELAHVFDKKESGDHGIGILNVQNRIRLCYGPQYGLTYKSRLGEGTRVEIRLPLREDLGDRE